MAVKISIITATLDSARFLEACIASVGEQGGAEIEHILVDGGSSDATLAIARGHPRIIVLERPGCGIYEAWNIGLTVATGAFIGFCNSDDFYAPEAIARVAIAVAAHPDAWLVSGRSVQFRHDESGHMVEIATYADPPMDRLRFEGLDLFGPAPNARFFARKLFDRFGEFDTRYRLSSDCAFLMKLALAELPVVWLDEIIYYYRSHPHSTTLGGQLDNFTITLDEKLRIGREFLSSGNLNAGQRHHLDEAMSRQLASTIWANIDAWRYGRAIMLLGRLSAFRPDAYASLFRYLAPVLLLSPATRILRRLSSGRRNLPDRG
jgi:glycosyltransferase involved in cell wall biosynthesis